MGRALISALIALTVWPILAGVAHASGDGPQMPWYLDQYGGEAPDLKAFYGGRLGIVMARAPRPRLLAAWRLLHGLQVGQGAGEALAGPCCGSFDWRPQANPQAAPDDDWRSARRLVPGAQDLPAAELSTERPSPNYSSTTNCYGDAFLTAARTLRDRIGRFGAGSPDVKAWLATQDAVFRSCGAAGVTLPPAPIDAPAWLKKDRAYQEAAFDFYDDRLNEAAARFAAIAADPESPWRPMGLYLRARALERQALAHPSPDAAQAARKAIADLAASPTGTYQRELAEDLSHILEFHIAPTRRMAELDAQLRRPEPPADIEVLFRDYSDLADAATEKPEIADWMFTLQARRAKTSDDGPSDASPAWAKRQQDRAQAVRAAALSHAIERWQATRDTAWLLAAISLVDPGEPEATGLVSDAGRVPKQQPAWLTLQFHSIRLTLSTADPAATRARLDAILAGPDLSTSDRNVLTSERMQVASDLKEFARLALRRRLCVHPDAPSSNCARNRWIYYVDEPRGVFDGDRANGSVGLGEDARAVIDRLPLDDRIALSRDTTLPAKIRMDIALTSFARALQLQDEAALVGLARELEPLLPQMAPEWRAITAAEPGLDRRFAVDMVMAKIPGLRADLVDYVRPEGPVRQFQRHWMDWIILPRGQAKVEQLAPQFWEYQTAGYLAETSWYNFGYDRRSPSPWRSDLVCLGECGRGATQLRLPDFAAKRQGLAAAERAYFVRRPDTELDLFDYATGKSLDPPPTPAGATVVWEEMLAYAKAHPTDPRIPEALHWIVHASHFGASHDHSGRRAFQLLQRRYPTSVWAKQTQTYSE